jgi:RNA polymerase sigma-70 factor (ECF subfamily)
LSIHEREKLFKQWIAEHQPILLKVARAYADSRDDQDDLLQEMLLQVWRSIPSFQGDAKPSTWIYRVALNASIAWKRTETRRRHHQRALADAEGLPDCRNDGRGDEANRAAVEQLYAAVRRLSPFDRSLVLLYLDGMSYREMADVLGITESNVGVKLNRTKKQLAELLGDCPHE